MLPEFFLRNLTSKYVQFGRQKGTAILFGATRDWGAEFWHGGSASGRAGAAHAQ